MSFIHPSGYFTDVNVAAVVGGVSGIFLPYTALESYNYANRTDVLEFVYSVVDKVATVFDTLSVASGDRPTNLTISKNFSAQSETSVTKSYNMSVKLDVANATYSVQDEA